MLPSIEPPAHALPPRLGSAAARDFARESLAALGQAARAHSAADAAALAVLKMEPEEAASKFANLCADGPAGGEAVGPCADLYEAARSADTAGHKVDAALLLAVLAGTAKGRRDGLLGLAVLAIREGLVNEAWNMISAQLESGDRHPRALSIAGICELERGDAATAQSYLAAASRMARREPAYRAELQMAQRALLLMHLG